MSLRDDLSDNARVILEGLYECGGEANMTEMKQFTGIDENKTLLYHTEEYLEPSDFVEYEVVDDGSATGITEFRLTDRGQEAVESVIEGTDDPNLVEQVEELREVVSGMKREVDTFTGRIDHFEKEIEGFRELANEVDAALDRVEVLDEHIEELRRRVDHVEEHPFEDVVEKKMAELRQVAAKVENADAMNRDVRRALRQNGVISATRKPVTRADVPESEYEWLDKQTDSPVRNTPQRDAYEAGPMIDVVAEGTDKLEAEITDAVIPEEVAEKLIALDEAGLLDDMIDQVTEIVVEGDETAAEGGSSDADGGDEHE